MSYTERFDKLYVDLRVEVRNKVKELGKSISIADEVDIETRGGAKITAVGSDVVYNKYGYEFNYSELDIEDFCALVDYIKTL